MKRRFMVLVALLFGCCELEPVDLGNVRNSADDPSLGTAEQAALVPGESFGFQVTERKELVQEVLKRYEKATCMRLEITDSGPHSIAFAEQVKSGGGIHGTWDAARISVQTGGFNDKQVAQVVAHELGHLLGLTNEHMGGSVLSDTDQFAPRNAYIASNLLARICSVRDCNCFSPEY